MSKQVRKITVDSNKQRIHSEVRNLTVDEESRTVELVWSTGSKGLRRTWMGSYYEELEISEKAIDMARLNSGAPLLAVHESRSLDNVIGVVERAWIDGDQAKALVRFAKDEISDRVFRKVADGILKNVSVGYNIEAFEERQDDGDDVPTYKATRWEPMEISIVPIGFDKNAQLRSQEQSKEVEIKIINSKQDNKVEENRMTPEQIEAQKLAAEAAKKEAVEQERTRCLKIRALVKEAGLPEEMSAEYIEREQTIEQVTMHVNLFRKYANEKEKNLVQAGSSASVTSQLSNEESREAIVEALLHRVDSKSFSLTERAKSFHGQSLMRVFEKHIGRNPMESDSDFAKRVMTTSDLPYILANVAQKTAQKRYQLAPKTFERWTTSGTLKDYKETLQVRGGDIGELLKIDEAGEYKEASLGEERETAKLEKYGRIHSFSDIMIINDDLGIIMQIAQESGVAQARLDNKLAYAAILDNPLMSDGEALFSVAHKNLGTPGAISETTFNEAFVAMRTQLSVDGVDQLNISPRYLIVGPTLETAAKKFLAIVQPQQNSNVNVFSNSVELIVDAAITDDKYFFVADPALVESVKVNRLMGQENIKVDSRVNWRNDAVEIKLTYSVQAKAMDFRGLFRNEVAG